MYSPSSSPSSSLLPPPPPPPPPRPPPSHFPPPPFSSFFTYSLSPHSPLLPPSPFKRILPLPSDHWNEFTGNIFCHAHQQCHVNVQHSSLGLQPREEDCLISKSFILLRSSALDFDRGVLLNQRRTVSIPIVPRPPALVVPLGVPMCLMEISSTGTGLGRGQLMTIIMKAFSCCVGAN